MRALGAVLLLATACADPVHDEAVESLGPEAPGVDPGPLHRPGQPCNACHDGRGPGNLVFSLAGTVYQTPDATDPLPGALVRFIDSEGRTHQAATNCAGNFFVLREDFEPAWPVWTKVRLGELDQPMGSPSYREGSCAACHAAPSGPASAGPVYFAPEGFSFPPTTCP